jgi:hypothetical protein
MHKFTQRKYDFDFFCLLTNYSIIGTLRGSSVDKLTAVLAHKTDQACNITMQNLA